MHAHSVFIGLVLIGVSTTSTGAEVFINEFHYDNVGRDVEEFVEIAGPTGLSLDNWTLILVNGANGEPYETLSLSGELSSGEFAGSTIEPSGLGALAFKTPGMQNGPDALALLDDRGTVREFLSYEGVVRPRDGSLAGMQSVDIGIHETNATPLNHSLQRRGSGRTSADFVWINGSDASPGALNEGQSVTPVPIPGALVSMLSALSIFGGWRFRRPRRNSEIHKRFKKHRPKRFTGRTTRP